MYIDDFKLIDWDEIWGKQMQLSSWAKGGEECWDERAEAFNRDMKNNEYVSKMLEKINITRDSTVLDIGCGPGTLAIPLAKRVKSVTALDLSRKMLQYVANNAASEDLNNITCLQKNWSNIVTKSDIDQHDVVICSRAFPEHKPLQAIELMNSVANKFVYIVMWANGDEYENFYRLTYGNVGKGYRPAPDYIYICNMLYQKGIYANVEYINYLETMRYRNMEDAINDWSWRIKPENNEQKNRLKDHLLKYLVSNKNFLSMELNCRWALLWWKKTENE